MAYKPIEDPDFLQDLYARKEFYELKFDPEHDFRHPGHADPLEGHFLKMHSHQLFERNFVNPNTPYRRKMLKHDVGTGKCLMKGTKILMYDGSLCNVEDVMAGDYLMGDDSTPRCVLSTCRGDEQMYRVVPKNGDAFSCNVSHILSLKRVPDMSIVDVSVGDIVHDTLDDYRLYRVGVNFEEAAVTHDPYALACYIYGAAEHHSVVFDSIPHSFKCNSRAIRMQVLAGVVDTCGRCADGTIDVLAKTPTLAQDLLYLARSLGYAAYARDITAHGVSVSISGRGVQHIPTRFVTIDACELDALSIQFTLEEIPWDTCHEYYGFNIDGNHRFLLGDFTVTHNTMSAIAIAQSFAEVYKKQYMMATLQTGQIGDKRRVHMEADKVTPSIFVFGFEPTKKAFYRDLMRYPEFGFISPSEKEELIKLAKLASSSGIVADRKRYKDEEHRIRKRVTNKSKDGFYKFYGYQKFVNMLFLSNEVSLVDLEKMATSNLRNAKPGDVVQTLEELVADHVAKGKIQINQQLLDQFRGSLIICDEFHNTYNMNMKNNYGVAVQYVLDYHGEDITAVMMSATPINNSPTEIVEVINYLVPPAQKVTKRDMFVNNRDLRPGMLEKIGELCRGRVSFVQDFNPIYFPRRVFLGETDRLPREIQGVSEIPYLKFVLCPMSKLHQDTYIELMNQQDDGTLGTLDTPDEENTPAVKKRGKKAPEDTSDEAVSEELEDYDTKLTRVPTNGYSIYDVVFPNPESETLGLFRSAETRSKLMSASADWRAKYKIEVKKFSATNNIITGEFLHISNIDKYTTKYFKMLEAINDVYAGSLPLAETGRQYTESDAILCGEKIMIYHDRVKMSGVLLIQEILRQNGFVDEFSEAVDSTRCALCTGTMANHVEHVAKTGLIEHKYRPARFVMTHSDIDRNTMEASMAKFSSADNVYGTQYKILVGSKIIREGYEMKDVQNLFLTMLPVNIPALIQAMGRCIRKNSHVNLPPAKRIVKTRIFLSTLDRSRLGNLPGDSISPEELRYIEKLNDYGSIQRIEREWHRNAVDAAIHRDIIMPKGLLQEYFPGSDIKDKTVYQSDRKPVDHIGNLYFDVEKPQEYSLKDLNLLTFTAYKYYDEEINLITYLVKRLFMRQPVWTYDDLWTAVRRPPFGTEINPRLFSEGNFVIALNKLIAGNILTNEENLENVMSKIFDPNDKYVYIGKDRFVIQQVDKYYIMFPVVAGQVIRDADAYMRVPMVETGVKIDMDKWVEESKADYNYNTRKNQFKMQYCGTQDIMSMLGDFDSSFYNRLLEDIIVWSVDGTPKVDEQLGVLYTKVLELFDRFRIIVYLDEVIRYRDTAKKFTRGKVVQLSKGEDDASKKVSPVLPLKTPVGFLTQKSVRLYDSPSWIEVSKTSMNKRTQFVENDTIVGYFDPGADGKMKFKLRKPIQQLRKAMSKDTRTIERGIVCSTKSKEDLIAIAKNLNIDTKKMAREDYRIKTLCDLVKSRLLEMEMRHRQRDDKYKVFYLWNENQPNLQGLANVDASL